MSASPTAASADPACLHCSPARTVWLTHAVATRADSTEATAGTWHTADKPEAQVREAQIREAQLREAQLREAQLRDATITKVYVAGSMAEAQHEVAMGMLAQGTGVALYREACTDAASNRPAVTMQFSQGHNLDALVAERGAIPAADALTLIASVADTIARLHALRTPELPNGMCHGDVKPQNILAVAASADEQRGQQPTAAASTVLLDFEHACAIGTAREGNFTGGTSAYSPPEAHAGQPPNQAFDVFGLGATLAFLLDGGTVRRVPRHPEVEALVMTCCAPDPANRPTAKTVADRCKHVIKVVLDDPAEQTLHDWTTGACAHPPTDRSDVRSALWPQRRRLLDRLPTLLRSPASLPSSPEGLQRDLDLVQRVLDRFPRNPQALARRQQLLAAIRLLLQAAAATVRSGNKAEKFEQTLRWLRTTEALTTTAMSVAGGLANIVRLHPGHAPGALQRAPIEFLRLLIDQTESAQHELQRRADEVSAAERDLDLPRAEQCIDAMAADYGGTSKTVCERRDQLHRLGFYLDRIARAQAKVERVGPLWDPLALAPLQDLVRDAALALETSTRREPSNSGAVGLRSLQVTLTSIADEFPHLPQVQPALQALSQTLVLLTDHAWQQLDDAEQRLTIVPVPVRPLQLALGRLDTFRMLEAFVDRAEHPRSELLDGIERLRLGLEQARSARDRLAENAEHALSRGHWTTGLFDMERAVERLNTGDDSEHVEAERLRERLQAARRTKQEIETALRRNVELTATYTTLEDDPMSTFEARLRVLQERRDCLMFLELHVPSDRADLYRRDLRSVETQLAVERAADAERRLDELTDPVLRLRLARSTAESLGATDSSSGGGIELSGRLVRLQEHWRTVGMQCQRAVDLAQEQEQQKQRQRRRLLAIAVVAVLAMSTAIGFALKPWLTGEPALAGEKQLGPDEPAGK